MLVVIDTSVWSEFFRRKRVRDTRNVEALKALVAEGRAVMPGIVKQELLSGLREIARFEKLRDVLAGFDPLLATEADHVLAARYFNACRAKGVQGSFSDFLICAQATNGRMSLLSSDRDFAHYSQALPVKLHVV